jgi:uncharacterized protein YyaL (SSP411 family)
MASGTHLDGAGHLVRRLQRLRGRYKSQPKVVVGYTADYAVYVHENLEAYHSVGQAKFLESAVRRYRREMGMMVRRDMSKGGKTLREACLDAGRFLQARSMDLCPVDTGNLRGSCVVRVVE